MNVLIVGATSEVAQAFMIEYARLDDHFVLAARNKVELEITAADLQIRSRAKVSTLPFDAEVPDSVPALAESALSRLEKIDGVVVAFGYLGKQERTQQEEMEVERIVTVNLTAAIQVIESLVAHLEVRGTGWILGLSSVAGVRGREGNYTYGAAKSGFTTYLEGLAQRVSRHGVKVKIAKLGFVASRMTRGQSMPRVLVTTPEHVARRLVWFLHSRFQSAYLPWRWWPVMTIVRLLPAFIYNRTRL